VFPSLLKKAVVVPIFKKGNPELVENYRPIALLSIFSKIFEKAMRTRLLTFLDDNQFFCAHQFGFKKGTSTEDAIAEFMKGVYTGMNENKKVSGLFIDFRQAYDLIVREILLEKLEAAGIRGPALKWFSTFLKNRIQQVRTNNNLSDERQTYLGIPQGSVLAADLFKIFINDLLLLPFRGTIIAFADDIAFRYCADTWETIRQHIEHDLNLLKYWCDNNGMKINVLKTKIINFDFSGFNFEVPFRYHICCDQSNCNCEIIEQTNNIKYLGIYIDNKISWDFHINKLNTELRKKIRIFYFLRNICSVQILRNVYFALVHSRIQYGLEFWAGTHEYLTNKIFVTQKYFVRTILFKNQREHTRPLFKQLNILPLKNLFVFKVLKVFYRRSGNRGTENLFYRTRSTTQQLFSRPKVNKAFFSKTFLYLGPKCFNLLPNNIKTRNSLISFTKHLKSWLIEQEDINFLIEIQS